MNLDIDLEVESCVYKLWHGDKYVIVKGKNLAGSVFLIEKGFAYFIAGGGGSKNNFKKESAKQFGEGQKEGTSNNTFYWKFYTHLKDNPSLPSRIEVLLESNNPYQLLKREQLELNKSFSDKNCLNNNIVAYVPKFNRKTWQYGWIGTSYVANFQKFLNK